MNHHFLEYIGQSFIYAAKYQKGINDLFPWLNQKGTGSFDALSAFNHFFCADHTALIEETVQAIQRVQSHNMELFSIPRMVPEKKYQKLEKEYLKLKEKYDLQKKTIENLSTITKMSDTFQNNINQGIDHVMTNQQKILEKMFATFTDKHNVTANYHPKKDSSLDEETQGKNTTI